MSLVLENVQMKAIRICKSKAECDNSFEVVTCSAYGMCKRNPAGIYKHPWEKWKLNCHESYIRCLHRKAHGGCVCAVSGEGDRGWRNLLWQENSTRKRDDLQTDSLLRAVQRGLCVEKQLLAATCPCRSAVGWKPLGNISLASRLCCLTGCLKIEGREKWGELSWIREKGTRCTCQTVTDKACS